METAEKQNISLAMCEPVYHTNFKSYTTNNIKKKCTHYHIQNSKTLMKLFLTLGLLLITISLTSCSTSSAGAKRAKKYNHAVARAHIGARYNI